MTWRISIAMALAGPLALCGCFYDPSERDALIRESGERWVLAGHYVGPRESGLPRENWAATFELPHGPMTGLVRIPMKTPDGEDVLFRTVAYNERAWLLIYEHYDHHDDILYNDVWRYDLATGQARWIAKARWDCTRGFTWSPDGSKVAFVASTRGSPVAVMQYRQDNADARELLARKDNDCLYYVSKDLQVMRVDVRTVVMEYDVHTDKLEEVAADACRFGAGGVRPRRPAYSEDGNWLYYVSMDRHVMRVDLRTRQSQRLPFTNAIAVLTVKGEYLVYAKEFAKGGYPCFQVLKVNLAAPDDSHSQLIHVAWGELCDNCVSPSGRFVLFAARAGYAWDERLCDVDTGKIYWAGGLLRPEGLAHSTVFVGSAGPQAIEGHNQSCSEIEGR